MTKISTAVSAKDDVPVTSSGKHKRPASDLEASLRYRYPTDASTAAGGTSGQSFIGKQYAPVYWYRLEALRPAVKERCLVEFGRDVPLVESCLDVDQVQHQTCILIGTIFCDWKGKWNVLEELAGELNILIPPTILPDDYKYYGEKREEDCIFLEDESGRIELVDTDGLLAREQLVTGVVCAVLGHETAQGAFEVTKVCYPGYAPHLENMDVSKDTDEQSFVALVSGLDIANDSTNADEMASESFYLEMLVSFLTGCLGDHQDLEISSKIERLIIAGNSLFDQRENKNDDQGVEGLQLLDSLLHTLSRSMPIDLMPGSRDPTTVMLPQRPLHRAMFEQCAGPECSGLACRTNPFSCTVGEKLILGTSGQNLDDLMRYFKDADPLVLASKTMKWRHIAPTAPDTLYAFPFVENDPFLIKKSPDVYFIGNQREFRTETVTDPDSGKMIRIILIPSFKETRTLVLLNPKTLECRSVRFD